jgi:hypothetical protein
MKTLKATPKKGAIITTEFTIGGAVHSVEHGKKITPELIREEANLYYSWGGNRANKIAFLNFFRMRTGWNLLP